MRPLVESGRLGAKSGRGFYSYPAPAYQQAGFAEGNSGSFDAYPSLACTLIAHAILVAAAGVADPEDIDRAWTVGTYLDAGPFALLEQMGEAPFRTLLARELGAGRLDPAKARKVMSWLDDNKPD